MHAEKELQAEVAVVSHDMINYGIPQRGRSTAG